MLPGMVPLLLVFTSKCLVKTIYSTVFENVGIYIYHIYIYKLFFKYNYVIMYLSVYACRTNLRYVR